MAVVNSFQMKTLYELVSGKNWWNNWMGGCSEAVKIHESIGKGWETPGKAATV